MPSLPYLLQQKVLQLSSIAFTLGGLPEILYEQYECIIGNDNSVSFNAMKLQILTMAHGIIMSK